MTATEPLDLNAMWDRSTTYMALWDVAGNAPTAEQVAAAVATAEDVRALLDEVERLTEVAKSLEDEAGMHAEVSCRLGAQIDRIQKFAEGCTHENEGWGVAAKYGRLLLAELREAEAATR